MAVLTSAVAIPEETGGNTVTELLRTVFGTSESGSGSDTDGEDSPSPTLPRVLTVPAVDGLTLHKRFLTESEQAHIYQHVVEEGWFRVSGVNQVMIFGDADLPEWSRRLAASLPSLHFPSLVRIRAPLYDSLTVNSYKSGEGICPHVDLLRYEDGIAIVSLLSAVNMEFSMAPTQAFPTAAANVVSRDQNRGSQPLAHSSSDHLGWELDSTFGGVGAHLTADDATEMAKSFAGENTASQTSLQRPIGNLVLSGSEQSIKATKRCPDQLVRLEPGDVLTLHSAARYVWTHGILAVPADMWHGQTVDRRQRISLTFRTLSRARDVEMISRQL